MFSTVVVSVVVVLAVLAAGWYFWLKPKIPSLEASVVKNIATAQTDVKAVEAEVKADEKKL